DAGGAQAAFWCGGKALQAGRAREAGVRAARLAAAGAPADPAALDQWLQLVGAGGELVLSGPAVPDGLAIKIFPCCYALQRPIAALRERVTDVKPEDVIRIVVRTPAVAVQPLHHHSPKTGLQGKSSRAAAVATARPDP